MTGRTIIAAVCVVAALVLLGVTLGGAGSRSDFAGPYSSYSAAPDGTRALYMLVERLGRRPGRVVHNFKAIPETGTIISIAPDGTQRDFLELLFRPAPFSDGAADVVADWVAEGNTFILLAPQGGPLPDRMGLAVQHRDASLPGADQDAAPKDDDAANDDPDASTEQVRSLGDARRALEARDAHAWPPKTALVPRAFSALGGLEGVEALAVHDQAGHIVLDSDLESPLWSGEDARGDEAGLTPLFARAEGGAVAVELTYGAGRFVWVTSPYIATNKGLSEADNAVFLARMIAPTGRVYVDEFNHGFAHSRSLAGYLRDTGLWVVVLQLTLMLAVLAWRLWHSFGPRLALYDEERRGTADYVRAVSLIYRHGGHEEHALGVVWSGLEHSAAARFRVGPGLSGAALRRALREQGHEAAATRLEDLDREVQRARSAQRGQREAIVDAVEAIARQERAWAGARLGALGADRDANTPNPPHSDTSADDRGT